jgi:Asp-tRNA(Asn)/Glu-tRNA(Gln) amidotransferase A subunit family amidase
MAAITDLSASELVEKITAGELSVQEVTEAHIQHIERVNGKLNAVVIPLFDEARAQAKGDQGTVSGCRYTNNRRFDQGGWEEIQ